MSKRSFDVYLDSGVSVEVAVADGVFPDGMSAASQLAYDLIKDEAIKKFTAMFEDGGFDLSIEETGG